MFRKIFRKFNTPKPKNESATKKFMKVTVREEIDPSTLLDASTVTSIENKDLNNYLLQLHLILKSRSGDYQYGQTWKEIESILTKGDVDSIRANLPIAIKDKLDMIYAEMVKALAEQPDAGKNGMTQKFREEYMSQEEKPKRFFVMVLNEALESSNNNLDFVKIVHRKLSNFKHFDFRNAQTLLDGACAQWLNINPDSLLEKHPSEKESKLLVTEEKKEDKKEEKKEDRTIVRPR